CRIRAGHRVVGRSGRLAAGNRGDVCEPAVVTTVDTPKVTEPTPPSRPGPVRTVLAFLRNTWRGLTAMRTALVLLFLLALAALPGALLPQRALNEPKVEAFIAAHGWWGQLLDRLEFYTVYSSVWFSAIYV